MNADKEKLLNETYDKFIRVSMNKLPPEIFDDIAAENIMGYGTAIDEKILSVSDSRDLIDRQMEQLTGMELNYEIIPGLRRISPEEDSVLIVDEIKISIKSPSDTHKLFIRNSTIMEYIDGKWKAVHFHSSRPDDTKGESDTWYINEWKRKNEELQNLVNEKTTELVIKNRDLEIEASLERVRTIAMGMRRSEDLLDICKTLFDELRTLGFDELRNTMINIHNDEEETFINYDYSDTLGKTITPLYYNINPVIAKQIKQIRKGRDAFSETSFKGDDLKEWKKFRKRKGESDDPRLKNTKALYYYFYSIGTGSIGISTFESVTKEQLELLKRFRNVFEFAYRRYMDVMQAEEQTREAKIEAALERVRSRTMAMQKSDELSETTFILFQQFMDLGEAPDQITIGIINKEEKVIEFWTTMEGHKVNQMVKFPIKETNLMRKLHTAWKKQKKSLALEIKGKELHDYIDYRIRLTGVKTKKDHVYERRFINAAFFSKGMITISTNEPRSKETLQLLERFAGVFDLTYTRFLDLKQAEAQTKEAQIELSLERVRARSMAMHRSDELVDSSIVLFNELKSLGIDSIRTGVGIFDETKKAVEIWSSQLIKEERNKILGIVPFKSHPFFELNYKAWKRKEPYFFYEIAGKDVKKYYKIMSSVLTYQEIKEFNPKECFYTFFFPEGSLNVVSKNNLTDDECRLMLRFAKVFGMIYRRFLDLQKAEAQAKEAQIELALERVRARTMAMQRSNELEETSQLLFQQFKELGEHPDRISIGIINEDERHIELWVTVEGDKNRMVKVPIDEPIVARKLYTGWKELRKSMLIELTGKELKDYLAFRKSFGNTHGNSDSVKDRMISYVAFFSRGIISITPNGYLPKETIQLLERFAGVFDLTYTRFLDLQKAEEQAREALIEVALERVRSRTMAMHKSEELAETAAVLFQQLCGLGIDALRLYIGIIMEESDEIEFWTTDYGGNQISSKYKANLFGSATFKKIYEGWKEKQKSIIVDPKGKELTEHLYYLKEIMNYPIRDRKTLSRRLQTIAYFSQGLIGVLTNDELPDESINLLERFAGVFDLTYRRFLDLQKAEAQTREAQIEVALERVRSRTMAMHSSDELQDAAILLFQQISELGVDTGSCGYVIWENKNKDATVWMSSAEGGIQEPFKMPHTKSKTYKEIYSAREEGKEFFVKEVSGAELKKHFDYLTTVPGIGEKIKQLRKARYKFPETIVYNTAFFKQGYLSFHTHEQVPEAQDIFRRFANVFEQTYTRFLDLQKAEAQAREAQIELGLERVRTRAMAMQKSDELSELVDTVFKELTKLDFALTWCIINIIDAPSLTNMVWAANPETNKPPESYLMKFEDYPFHHSMMKGYQERKTKHIYVLEGIEKKTYDDYLFNKTEWRRVPKAAQAASRAMKRYVASFTFSNFGGIQTVGEEYLSEENLDILSRFGKVFDLTYTRFNDLKLAEAQAAEAKIEAALERVRSRTMGMQKSEELKEVIQVVLEQFVHLNINAEHAGFVMDYKARDDYNIWIADPLGVPSQVTIPYFDSLYYNQFNEAKEKGVDFFATKLSFKEKNRFYKKLFKFIPGLTEEAKGFYFSCPGLAVSTVLLENVALYIENFSGTPYIDEENATLMRFGKVFQQTYTRFLDLQKAEAQAREGQIELGLERVRARAMAMQNSKELEELIGTVFTELTKLDLALTRCIIWVFEPATNAARWWMANSEEPSNPMSFFIKYHEHPAYLSFVKEWKRQNVKFVYDLNGEDKTAWDDILFNETELKMLPEAVKDGMRAPGRVLLSGSFNNFGGINTASLDPLSEEHFDILLRFAKVFDLTYTRFNDLQKAEAQAREAKIETSLERVRSKTMAMHNSPEVGETVAVMFDELRKLGIETYRCGIGIMNETKEMEVWAAKPDDKGKAELIIEYLDMSMHPLLKGALDNWKNKKDSYYYHLKGNDLINYFNAINKHDNYPAKYDFDSLPQEIFHHDFYFKEGTLFVFTLNQLTSEDESTLKRFAGVFGQTYRRYLDLQKAEAQAREAQIEAALERTRTQSMIMQHSNELDDTLRVFHEQVLLLGIQSEFSFLWLPDQEKDRHIFWVTWLENGNDSTVFKSKAINYPLDRNEPSTEQCMVDWKSEEAVHSYNIPPTGVKDYFAAWSELFEGAEQLQPKYFKKGLCYVEAFMKYGCFGVMIKNELSGDEKKILLRFAIEFERTYTRFLDLQKAEAQTREAQIEAALERVRGKAMAMHNSSDLTDAAGMVFTELNNLGINPIRSGFVLLSKDNRLAKLYPATSFDNKNTVSFTGEFEFTGHPVYEMQYESWQKKENYFPVLEGDLLKSYYKILAEGLSVPYENFPTDKKQFGTFLPFSEGFLFTWSGEPYSGYEINILDRFKAILDLTIRRYTDLKTAEAQSRESQIEGSLERVRSKAMAMQKSDDLAVAVAAIFEELERLDLGMLRCGIGILSKEHKYVDVWATAISDGEKTLQLSGDESMDSHPLLRGAYDAWMNQEDFSYLLQGDDLKNYYQVQMDSNFKIPDLHSQMNRSEEYRQYYFVSTFQSGGLFAIREEEFPGEAKLIIKRFADVINFTYTRFNDLKQAEAQAKEAKIEAALERVRASALIMRNPEDMFDVCKIISEQLVLLNVNEIRNTQTVILNEGKETYRNYEYFPDYGEKTFSEIDYNLHPRVREFVNEIKKSSDAFFTTIFEGRELQEWRDYRKNTDQLQDPKLDAAQSVHYYFYSIGPGALGISTYAPLSEEEISIFKRFRNVFELAYRRYIDIEQAEAQAREAQIEASLERVRSRTLAMQKSDELAETAAVVFKQLINLGIEPNRLYIGIIHDESGDIEAWATDEDGSKVSKEFTLNINANASVKKMYDGWAEKKKSIIIDMQGEELESYIHYIGDELHVPFKGGLNQIRRVQNIAYFSKGFIGMASPDPQPEEATELLERFAAVFNLTFTRFSDLQIAEKHAEQAEQDLIKLQTEKKRAEEALTELRATQTQLIQSEKMASLGELTAGIAHEIQNPLNFVNNFSEVNTELIDELNEELVKGNYEEAVLIAKDIKENEEKIKHHGKRAEGIVKGMLQHSRSSSGVKEPTNINALADEYLRLAYHGLRAKDKSFNSKMETDFDESIGEINVVPQDIGRVILNLITNAFYAVTEKKKDEIKDYEPKVTVSTKRSGENVLISIKDNGNGIPQKVMEKIFQPFFTTKPTGQGTGLGLSMSYDIIKAHGGELKVETKEGEGAEFIVELLSSGKN